MVDQKFNTFREHIRSFTEAFLDSLPEILGAIVLIVIGWLVALGVRSLLKKLFKSPDRFLFRRSKGKGAKGASFEGSFLKLIPELVHWFLIFFFVVGATKLLGLELFADWFKKSVDFLPLLFIAFIIILTGVGIGQVFRNLLLRRGAMGHLPYAPIIGSGLQVAIVLISVIVALNTLGFDLSFLTTLVAVLLGGFLLTSALAFGFGSKDMIKNIISGHFAGKIYQVGHRVEVDGVRGTITRIGSGFVIIDTEEGEVSIPASAFIQKTSKKLK
jgi:small-conductance mechanosensitive channel